MDVRTLRKRMFVFSTLGFAFIVLAFVGIFLQALYSFMFFIMVFSSLLLAIGAWFVASKFKAMYKMEVRENVHKLISNKKGGSDINGP